MKTQSLTRLRGVSYAYAGLALAALTISLTSPMQAQNLVQNGDFTNFTGSLGSTGASQVGIAPCTGTRVNCGIVTSSGGKGGSLPGSAAFPLINNWTVDKGAVYLFSNNGSIGAADGHGAQYQFATTKGSDTTFQLWSTVNGGNSVVPSACDLAGCGGNFVAMDGDTGTSGISTSVCHSCFQGSISQTLNNLTPGDKYEVSFFAAAGQQHGFSGQTMTQLRVSLCGTGSTPGSGIPPQGGGASGPCTFYTDLRTNPSHNFQGWQHESFTFTATNSSNNDWVLNFLAMGLPTSTSTTNSEPPIVLLDGISVTAEQQHVIPEPGTWLLLGIGFVAIVSVAYRNPKWLHVPA